MWSLSSLAHENRIVVGTIAESGRLLLVQTLLRGPRSSSDTSDEESLSQKGIAGMSPLVGLYYFAPVCAVLNLFVAAMVEFKDFDFADLHRVGYTMLALNCLLAFTLNVAGVFLVSGLPTVFPRLTTHTSLTVDARARRQIGKTSALAMNLTGILKSIILVAASLLIWATPITFTQVLGYGIALAGMFYYSLPPEGLGPHVKAFEAWLGRVSSGDASLLGLDAARGGREEGEGPGLSSALRGEGVRDEEGSKGEAASGKVEGRQD